MQMQDTPGALGLSDGEFWTDPAAAVAAFGGRQAEEPFVGIVLDAPRRVPIATRSTLPAVVIHVATFRDNLWLDFSRASALVAVHRETGAIYAAPVKDPPLEDDDLVPVPDEDLQEGTTTAIHHVDLREKLGLAWTPGTYLVTLLLLDKMAPSVSIVMSMETGGYDDPEVAKLLDRFRTALLPPAVSPVPQAGQELPSYVARKDSPPVPDELGVVLHSPRVGIVTDVATWVVEGSFRVRLLPHQVIVRDPSLPKPKGPVPTGVVPITLVLVATRSRQVVIPLCVPTFDELDGASPVATGHFALDLLADSRVDPSTETFFLYAFCGPHVAGPYPTGWVDKSLLPPKPADTYRHT